MRRYVEPERTSRAIDLRQRQTSYEARLWSALRNRKLDGLKFRRQVAIGPYVADFVCNEARLIVELDGSQHGEATDYDERRTRHLEREGYRVVRFWNGNLNEDFDAVCAAIIAHARGTET